MCRYSLTKCFVAVVVLYSAVLFAGITKADANSIVLNNIIGEDAGKVNVYASNYTVIPTKPVVLWSGEEIITSYGNSWAYFVDDYPLGKWHHPCRIIFVNNDTGEYKIFDKTIFPVNYETEFELISAIAKNDAPELPVADTVQIEKALPNNNLYAVIINGSQDINEERFWNDMSAMYCTLIDVYGYTKGNIIVHYSGPLGNDLDNDGINEYLLNADKASIEATFAELTLKLGPADQLFIYIDGHGFNYDRMYGHLPPNEPNYIPKSYIDLGELCDCKGAFEDLSEDISDVELANFVKDINCAQMIFTIGCCYSGGFAHTLSNTDGNCKNVSVHTSSYDEPAWGEYWITPILYHEFFFYWIASVRGYYPELPDKPWNVSSKTGDFPFHEILSDNQDYINNGIIHGEDYNPDDNFDSFVQMKEVFYYTDDFNSWTEFGYCNPNDKDHEYPAEQPQSAFTNNYSNELLSLKGLCGYLEPSDTHKIVASEPVDPDVQTFIGNLMVNPRLTVKSGVYMKHSGDYTLTCVPDISKLPLDNGLIIEDQAGFILDGSNTVLQPGSQITMYGSSVIEAMGNSSLTGKVVTVPGSVIQVKDNSTFTLKSGAEVNIASGARIEVGNFALLIIEEGAELNSDLNSSITLYEGAQLVFNKTSSITNGLTVDMYKNSILKTGEGKSLFIEDGSIFNLYEGSRIQIGNFGNLIQVHPILVDKAITSPQFNYCGSTGNWYGIIMGVGGTLEFNGLELKDAYWALSGSPSKISLTNCNFTDCVNAINFVYCNDYIIENNTFTGTGSGNGISLTTFNSLGSFKYNTIEGFARGVLLTFSSPVMSKNIIRDNTNYGLYVNGYTSYPQLVNPAAVNTELNNQIIRNGLGTNYYESAQIYSKYSAAVYMENGMNNIYSELSLNLPTVPCYRGVGYTSTGEIMRYPTILKAVNNFWGAPSITDVNFRSYFDLYTWYQLQYEPYATVPFTETTQAASVYGTLSIEAKLLDQALKAEADGKIDLAIKKYERIIDKYPTSEENYVALSRLTDIYVREEATLEPLISIFDAQIASEDDSVNKHYFKEMKISSKIKTKKYDEALSLAQEMKNEAVTEGEVILADIDIAVINMLKDAENNGKGKSSVDSQAVTDLVNKLTGNEDKAEPADITESVLPSHHELFQNYPNPFNPVTQIRFALAKTSNVKLSVYNIAGQQVAELASGIKNAGYHTVAFDGSRFNSGVYYYTLEADGKTLTKKMILMK